MSLLAGPRGGIYYELNGKKVYVKHQEVHNTSWKEQSPRKGKERSRIYQECDAKGKQCFLRPDSQNPGQSGYPICSACRDPNVPCSCQPDCKGIVAAKARARQWKEAIGVDELVAKYECTLSSKDLKERIKNKEHIKSKERKERKDRQSSYKQVGGKFKMVPTGKTVCSPLGCFDEFDAIATKKQSKNNKTREQPLFL
jgi:hypothetical protein